MPQARDEAGNIWEVDAQGNPIALVSAAQQQMPADPTFRYQEPRAAADLEQTRAQTSKAQVDASVAQATAPAEIEKARAEAEKLRAEVEKMRKGGTGSDTERANALTGWESAKALDSIIADLEQKYREGPGSTKGVAAIADYLPTAANERFDRAANAARGIVGQALGFTGGQLNSAEEAKLNIGPYIPSSTDKDGTIEDAIGRLRELQAQAMQRSISILGGVPDENGNVQPMTEENRPSALNYLRTDGGRTNQMQAAGFNATQEAVPYPKEGQAQHDALVASLIASNGGRLDPAAYARARSELDRKFGVEGDPAAYQAWAGSINEYLEQGGSTIPTGIEPTMQDMGFADQAWNRAASSEMGAGVSGYLNSFGLGIPEALTGANMDMIREQNPGSALIGEIGGAIGGTAGIGMAGRAGMNALGRQGIQSQLGRNLATDVTYGAAYGGATEGDPLTGAALGFAGSLGGQALGKGAETIAGGVRGSDAIQRMRQAGVNLTPGRILGENASRIEDKMVSWPVVGDMIRNRQQEGFRQFNEAAFREGGAPIGYNPTAVGEEGIGQFRQAVGNAYDDATAGVSVPGDQQFFDDLVRTQGMKQSLPEELHPRFDRLMENHTRSLDPVGPTGPVNPQLTGEQFQRAMRGLKTARGKAGTVAQEFEQPYREAVTSGMDAFDGIMRRGGGQDVIAGLDAANAANKNLKILENASLDKAKIGTQTGEAEVFLPSQLIAAARQSERKYPGANPLKQLGKDGQEVLPSTVPNSGTADRAMLAGAGVLGLGGIGAGEYAVQGDADLTMKLGAGLAALAALNTKAGNRAFEKIALDRPDSLKKVAEGLRKRRRLFGAAGVPIALTAQ